MPRKSSKKGSKKTIPAAEPTLVRHRAPHLTDLLERAKKGKLSDVQQYLSAGGSPNVLVEAHVKLGYKRPLSDVIVHVASEMEAPLLYSVAASGHNEAAASIRLLLQAGAAVDAIEPSIGERTALMVACSIPNNLQAVKELLDGGADPCYQAGLDGISALHLAAIEGCTETCLALHSASSGRALEIRGSIEGMGATPLLAACVMNHYAVVELLCSLGADVSHSSVKGNTPLMAVARRHDDSILRLLLQQHGIKVNQRNREGDTALMKAAEAGNVAAVDLLLQHGADACNMNKSGVSAVFCAAAEGHLDVVKLLMQHGADVTATTYRGGTLLMHTATSNQPHVAEFLINEGLSVHAASDSGCTALHCAAASTSAGTETMHVLLAHGADVHAVQHSCGSMPLHAAASNGHLESVEALLAAGADIECSDGAGATALHLAVLYNSSAHVQLLLEHGATAVLNTMQCKKWSDYCRVSALMLCEDAAILKLLLTAGGDVHAVTSSGDTCLHIAAAYNYPAPVVCLLIKAGADMHALNSSGKTAAETARDSNNTLIEQLLIRAAQQA
jgi:ankyrin repeat protein